MLLACWLAEDAGGGACSKQEGERPVEPSSCSLTLSERIVQGCVNSGNLMTCFLQDLVGFKEKTGLNDDDGIRTCAL